uniref:glutathione transferase n=1 Tax=Acrobeloides nanus TaxID=290746 RepID=A0A914DNT2_9BILA
MAEMALSKNLDFKVESFKSHSINANNVLKAMNRDINHLVESNEANFRIKKNQMMTTNRKFHNLLIEFNNEQVRWCDEQRKRIRAYLQVSGAEMDDDAIEEAIENGIIYDEISILMAEMDKTKFEDVKSSPEDISKRLAGVREFYEIFRDMSMLVESQGEILDNIEANINSPTNYVNRTFQNVVYTKKARNRNIKLKIFAAISFQYGVVPVLEVDGKTLSQSSAINRYLARKYGLAGKDDFEAAQIDAVADFHKDVYNELVPYIYTKFGYMPGDPATLKQAFLESTDKLFPTYVKLLKESGSGFFAKSGLSWVDFVVANYLLSIRINEPEVLKKYPELEKYVDRVHAVPQIKEYVEKRGQTIF